MTTAVQGRMKRGIIALLLAAAFLTGAVSPGYTAEPAEPIRVASFAVSGPSLFSGPQAGIHERIYLGMLIKDMVPEQWPAWEEAFAEREAVEAALPERTLTVVSAQSKIKWEAAIEDEAGELQPVSEIAISEPKELGSQKITITEAKKGTMAINMEPLDEEILSRFQARQQFDQEFAQAALKGDKEKFSQLLPQLLEYYKEETRALTLATATENQ